MEEIANEYVAFLDYLGFGQGIELIAKENGGFKVHGVTGGIIRPDARNTEVTELSRDIVTKLQNPKSRVSSLREKFDKLREESYYLGGYEHYTYGPGGRMGASRHKKTEEGFKKYLEDYYEKDEASSTGTSQGSSVDDLTNQMGRIDLSPAGAPPLSGPSVEEQRQLAMKRPFIEEKVADFSDVFIGEPTKNPGQTYGEGRLLATGMAEHVMYGEKHHGAKLTGAQVTELRTRYFAGEATLKLANEFKISDKTVNSITSRQTWKHLPQVPGESDENFNRPNIQELRVMKIAREHGVEPIRNKIGRFALPPELLKRLRKERAEAKAEKKKESKE
jgi:hypothetical protein